VAGLALRSGAEVVIDAKDRSPVCTGYQELRLDGMANLDLFQSEVSDLGRDPTPLPQVPAAGLVIEQQQGVAFDLPRID
jgi:hypothetical protein